MNDKNQLQRRLNTARQISYLQERLLRYSEKYTSVRQIALHMLNACLVSLRFYRSEKNNLTGPLKICIKLGGGIGDVLIRLNWLCAFYKKFSPSYPMTIELSTVHKQMVKSFAPPFITKIFSLKESEKRNYDLIISLDVRVPVVEYAHAKRLTGELCSYIQRLLEFEQKYRPFLLLLPYRDSITPNIISEAQKWWQHPDVLGEFNLDEHFLLPIKLKQEQETLRKFNLKPLSYITVNREVGDSHLCNSTKLWPLAYYRELVEKIKHDYPTYTVVEIGTGKGERIGNTHLNLAGKTTLEEIKVILKHAALHIDSEGGLVHLRHALQAGPSLVFFGPSDPKVLGYSENINLRGNGCNICCEFYSNSWSKECIKQKHTCMESLHPDEVWSHINNSVLHQRI